MVLTAFVLVLVTLSSGVATADTVQMLFVRNVTVDNFTGTDDFTGEMVLASQFGSAWIGVNGLDSRHSMELAASIFFDDGTAAGGSIEVTDGEGGSYSASVVAGGTLSERYAGLWFNGETESGEFQAGGDGTFAGVDVSGFSGSQLFGEVLEFSFTVAPLVGKAVVSLSVSEPTVSSAPLPSALLSGMMLFGCIGASRWSRRIRGRMIGA